MRKIFVLTMAVALVAGLWTHPALGQEALEIQLKLAKGESVYAAFTSTGELSIQINAVRQSSTFQAEARQATRVLDVDQDGAMLVEVVLEEFRVRDGTRTEEILDAPILMKVRPDGRIAEKQAGEIDGDDYPIALPGRPVLVGETWNRQTRVEEAGITGEGTTTFTLAGVESTPEGRVARVTYRLEARVSGAGLGPMPPGTQARTSGTIRGAGEAFWSLDRGWLLRMNDETSIETTVEASGQGETVRMTFGIRIRSRWEPLAADRVALPAVAAEMLITPGKGIGAATLDLLVNDISGRLGASAPRRTEMGLRAPALNWPGGLTGYVDPQDGTKVIGLETARRTFRTDKGIGFGSSQGAVLLAYGTSPARVDLTIPGLGGARMLVYDDLGIAFAITSDQQHARAGPTHAPLGAVDWITVFPPGAAGKIFPLP